MDRFKWLWALAFLVAVALGGRAATPVLRDGKAFLPVLVEPGAAPQELDAAKQLASVLGTLSGIAWPVRNPAYQGEHGIYVGRGPAMRAGIYAKAASDPWAPKAGEISPDGFRIETLQGSVFIEGATPQATGYAVAWFLQHEAGVRWYVPGTLGTWVPHRAEWSLPDLHILKEPAFLSREFTGLSSAEGQEWAGRNGLRARLEFSHALSKVFSPALMAEHPEWLPFFQGAPYAPASQEDQNWQPNLALPGVADFASQAAAEAFDREPDRMSFSLGMNDTVRFDQSAATRALVEPLRYFRGMPDYGPLVFTFMNRAADSLARSHPDRFLGCLAYFWCENPPSFPVRPNIVPFVTTDRSQYYNREYRAADLALMSRWESSGARTFGLWEYAYGKGFLVPRLALVSMAESVSQGWHRGARGYFADIDPQWGFDSFKVWMLAQLLWEPDRSVEDLADDFYPGFFGPSAKPMRQFFERCEAQWMSQSGPPYWLKFYEQEDQALLFPPEFCRQMRGLLDDAARASADDPVIKARVDQTSRAFKVTEAFVEFDGDRRRLSEAAASEALGFKGGEAGIAALIDDSIRDEARLVRAAEDASGGPNPAMSKVRLFDFVRDDPVPRLLWMFGQRDADAPLRMLKMAGQDAANRQPWRSLAEALASGSLGAAQNLTRNGSFKDPAQAGLEPRFLYPLYGSLPSGWEIRAMPTQDGKAALVDTGNPAGPKSVRIEGAWDTQLFQWLPAKPGQLYVATGELRGKASPGNDSALFLTFLSATGKPIGLQAMQSLPRTTTSEWRSMALADVAPEGAVWVGVGVGVSRQVAADWFEVKQLELRQWNGAVAR